MNKFLPVYDFNEQHSIKVKTGSFDNYQLMIQTDLSRSLIIRTLFHLRGMPKAGTIQEMDKLGFVKLDEKVGEEIVFGIISKNAFFTQCRLHFTPQNFINENQQGSIKATINFRLNRVDGYDHSAIVSTETRILCNGTSTKNKFRLYWFVVQPFSKLIRWLMLLEIKRNIESKTKAYSIPSGTAI